MEGLVALALTQPDLWTFRRVQDTWEELCWRYNQEFSLMVQLVIRAARSGDNPRWPVITWAALCPRGPQAGALEGHPLWTNPTTFLLDHPQGYFVNHIILRL